ncbi:hypothetical protein CAOG_009851 [Capsaspora owczarzaki ATCC 30864]|uniref:Serine-threonine/tyrosine-protein kinase catalytic domain-containing protein n=1 Tax=Capsaspora owczarzaki (strain ATCC 30864) TaxID=595528 RepID=A0A0D2WRX8_CAPO3|nr:hypothetical protein CAOG_009851 [Capsaspora owczarzaki ATCC 30864]
MSSGQSAPLLHPHIGIDALIDTGGQGASGSLHTGRRRRHPDLETVTLTAWECCSYGATPYGKMDGRETLAYLEGGGRLPTPEHCTSDLFSLMFSCWNILPELRPSFTQLIKGLRNFEDGTTSREIGAML